MDDEILATLVHPAYYVYAPILNKLLLWNCTDSDEIKKKYLIVLVWKSENTWSLFKLTTF